jgi:phosphorylcholine metabolism protein LicD
MKIFHDKNATPTYFYEQMHTIVEKIPKNFSKCYIGHSPDENTCNTIPAYNYSKLDRVNEYIYKCPVPPKIVFAYIKNGDKIDDPDTTYMTIPLLYNKCNSSKIDPFENIWLKYPTKEIDILGLLEKFGEILTTNNIGYSLEGGTLLGFARQGKLIHYDDDLDIIANRQDIHKIENILEKIKKIGIGVYHYKNKLNNSLYAKIYSKNGETILYKNYEYKWPFIDIFVFDKTQDGIYLPEKRKTVKMSDKFIQAELTSHNTDKKYSTSVFKDYSLFLDSCFPNWKNLCVSSDRNHRRETENRFVYSFNCKNIIPGYTKNVNEKYNPLYSVKDRHNVILKFLSCLVLFYVTMIFIFKLSWNTAFTRSFFNK